ncbi:ATP-binding protein (plasmid) [Pedobacter sp. BS3]|uniref:ATP-binding protein n=1 Tax=Pedobacter sp. BS3 TaxID=2567937 RepID=UPI0011F036EC|nr:ATP-binding protein [Pedobacter sp. BS3]TZF86454.1 ATP-binding protein [Pedobacter sp. BS3]
MIRRSIHQQLLYAVNNMPVVALLGPRQVGKTTLALSIVKETGKPTTYIDLELDSDFNKLSDPEAYLKRMEGQLLIIDEVQRKPDLFRTLRALVDIRRRAGEKTGQFLLLGSASKDLLQHTAETLAGRIRYLELSPFNIFEILQEDALGTAYDKLWFRGGFPDSYLAATDHESWEWRGDFIASYVERDIPLMGPQVQANRIKTFWSMLAHYHGQQVVFSELGRSLELSHTTIRSYLDILTDFYMVRQLQPWSGNTKKRLVKSPKIYLRDSGILHRLLNISSFENLLGHPVLGASWEGFVVENILLQLSDKWRYSYYRSSNQAEIDLVLETPDNEVWAIEIKRSSAPTIKRSFHEACADVQAVKKFIVYHGPEQYPIANGVEVIGLTPFLELVSSM